MDNKKLGAMLILVAVVIAGTIYAVKRNNDAMIEKIVHEQGSCFLEDGTCLHENKETGMYTAGWVLSAFLAALAIYIMFFDRSQKEILGALERQRQIRIEAEKFGILLKGLSEDERKVITAVREQEGITQQTLRLRTGLHKSKLSIVLDGLEKKGLLARQSKGKTKQVFLRLGL